VTILGFWTGTGTYKDKENLAEKKRQEFLRRLASAASVLSGYGTLADMA
jgi:hypothetical protein